MNILCYSVSSVVERLSMRPLMVYPFLITGFRGLVVSRGIVEEFNPDNIPSLPGLRYLSVPRKEWCQGYPKER